MWSCANLPKSGTIYTVKELSEKCLDPGTMQGESVRLNGRLVEYKVDESLVKILDRNKEFCFWIDAERIEPFTLPLGATVQLVGEIEWRENQNENIVPLLKARTIRCVDNLDLIRYEKALEIQRNYLQEESLGSAPPRNKDAMSTEMECI